MINGHSQILVDKGKGLEKTNKKFKSEDQLRRLVQQIALSRGKRLDQSQPFVDLSLTKNIKDQAYTSIASAKYYGEKKRFTFETYVTQRVVGLYVVAY